MKHSAKIPQLTDSDTQQATNQIEKIGGLPENNPFTSPVKELLNSGKTWDEIRKLLKEVYTITDAASFEENVIRVTDWQITVIPEENTGSNSTYEFYRHTAQNADEAEQYVENNVEGTVVSDKTKKLGFSRIHQHSE